METEKVFTEQGQFSISHELVLLLDWLIIHKRDQLKNMIKKSVSQGLSQYILQEPTDKALEADLLYYTVLDFFETLETFLHEAIAEETTKQAHQNQFLGTINNFDTILDKTTVQTSLEKIVKQMPTKQDKKAREALMKEILMRWKPVKNQTTTN